MGVIESTYTRHHDEGLLHPGFDYGTDQSVDDAWAALDHARHSGGRLDAVEVAKYIMSGLDCGQFSDREARQISNALRLHYGAMTPEAKAIADRFDTVMKARVEHDLHDCSPDALSGIRHEYWWSLNLRFTDPDMVVMAGQELTQFAGEIAAMTVPPPALEKEARGIEDRLMYPVRG